VDQLPALLPGGGTSQQLSWLKQNTGLTKNSSEEISVSDRIQTQIRKDQYLSSIQIWVLDQDTDPDFLSVWICVKQCLSKVE